MTDKVVVQVFSYDVILFVTLLYMHAHTCLGFVIEFIDKYRSKLKLTQLAIVATISVIEKHGLHTILKPFIHDLNILSTTGIEVNFDGITKVYKGALLAFLADNLASNDLGGLKKSFSFAFRIYRTCLATETTLSSSFYSEAYEKRDGIRHNQHLREISNDKTNHYSKIYGINEKSSLMDVKYISLFENGLPHDLMYDLLEGLAPHEFKHMMLHYISNRVFTLQEFNDRLINFNFGYSETDKPLPILSASLKNDKDSIISFTNVATLPFLIADKVPEGDEHWTCFLLLRKMFDLILAPVATENISSSLKRVIKEHHSKFVQLYGLSAYMPKLHFLTLS